jgi:hypothetical protein
MRTVTDKSQKQPDTPEAKVDRAKECLDEAERCLSVVEGIFKSCQKTLSNLAGQLAAKIKTAAGVRLPTTSTRFAGQIHGARRVWSSERDFLKMLFGRVWDAMQAMERALTQTESPGPPPDEKPPRPPRLPVDEKPGEKKKSNPGEAGPGGGPVKPDEEPPYWTPAGPLPGFPMQ